MLLYESVSFVGRVNVLGSIGVNSFGVQGVYVNEICTNERQHIVAQIATTTVWA